MPGGDLGRPGIGSLRCVVDHVGARLADRLGDLGAVGVDGDDEIRMTLPDRLHQLDDATHFLAGGHLLARSRLDAADVNDRGPLLDDLVDPVQCRAEPVGPCAVVERIRGSVDDRHDDGFIRGQLLAAEDQHC